MSFETYDKEKYRKFTSDEEATAWGEEHYGKWVTWYKDHICSVHSLNSTALKQYLSESYKHINPLLRSNATLLENNGSGTDNHYLAQAEVLDTTLCLAPRVPENIVVYRHITNDVLQNEIIKANRKEGAYKEEGFLSTSLWPGNLLDEARQQNEVWLKIYVRAGTPGLCVQDLGVKTEQELLINRGMFLKRCKKKCCFEMIKQEKMKMYQFTCLFFKRTECI